MRKRLTAILLATLLAACHKQTLFHSYQPIPGDKWDRADTISFLLPPTRDSGDYNLTVGLRLRNNFPYQQLWMVVEQQLEEPIAMRRDTICHQLADSTGALARNGTNLLQYEVQRLPLPLAQGQHGRIRLYHIMSREVIPAVSDVGIKISLANH